MTYLNSYGKRHSVTSLQVIHLSWSIKAQAEGWHSICTATVSFYWAEASRKDYINVTGLKSATPHPVPSRSLLLCNRAPTSQCPWKRRGLWTWTGSCRYCFHHCLLLWPYLMRKTGDSIISSVKCRMNKYSLSLINGTLCDLTNWENLVKMCLAHISSWIKSIKTTNSMQSEGVDDIIAMFIFFYWFSEMVFFLCIY